MSPHQKPVGPIDPGAAYVYLSRNGSSAVFEGGEKFWSLPPGELEKLGRGWLVSEFSCSEDWPNWEMHPEGDEVVYVLEGDVEFLVEEPTGVRAVRVQGRGLVIVPRSAWHTARVHAPSRLLHVTMGAGTRHRPFGAARGTRGYELAQFNLGIVKGPMDSPFMADFVASLDRINAAADQSPGFVWRLTGDAGDAAVRRYLGAEHIVANLSVWQGLDPLRRFVYESGHLGMLQRRRDWFERLGDALQVLWWVPKGRRPEVAEALARLELLRSTGPNPEAFTFRDPYPAPDEGRTASPGGSVTSSRE
jgi:mannose-6-phosphate isomerase-like protein (cupin superfamily)